MSITDRILVLRDIVEMIEDTPLVRNGNLEIVKLTQHEYQPWPTRIELIILKSLPSWTNLGVNECWAALSYLKEQLLDKGLDIPLTHDPGAYSEFIYKDTTFTIELLY